MKIKEALCLVASAAALSLALGACGSNDNKTEPAPQPAPPAQPFQPSSPRPAQANELEGSWQTDCVALGDAHMRVHFVFAGDRMSGEMNLFGDESCGVLMGTQKVERHFRIGEEIAGQPGLKRIDWFVQEDGGARTQYDIYKISNGQLNFASRPADAEAQRPTQLNMGLGFHKGG